MRLSCYAMLVVLVGSSVGFSREWTDDTNTYHADAQFISVQGDNVLLQTSNGKTVSCPWTRLSLADQTYIRQLLNTPVNAEDDDGHKKTATVVVQGSDAVLLAGPTPSEKRSPYQFISQREDPAIVPEARIGPRCAYIGHFGSLHLLGAGGSAAYELGNRKYICDLSLSKKDNAFWDYQPINGDPFTSHWAFSDSELVAPGSPR